MATHILGRAHLVRQVHGYVGGQLDLLRLLLLHSVEHLLLRQAAGLDHLLLVHLEELRDVDVRACSLVDLVEGGRLG
jgi:hypothetical protein